jgi:hypothetical protein
MESSTSVLIVGGSLNGLTEARKYPPAWSRCAATLDERHLRSRSAERHQWPHDPIGVRDRYQRHAGSAATAGG